MQDLTQGSIPAHIARFAAFIFFTMLFQTLYFLVDLYFVGRLGSAAVAAVSIAGNLMFLVMAVTTALGVGTTTLVSQAIGAKDQPGAELNAYWYMRNAKMFAKVGLFAKPGDRILVLVGAGHRYWLTHFAENVPGFISVDPTPYLRRAARASR